MSISIENIPVKNTFIHYSRDPMEFMDDMALDFEHGSYWSYPDLAAKHIISLEKSITFDSLPREETMYDALRNVLIELYEANFVCFDQDYYNLLVHIYTQWLQEGVKRMAFVPDDIRICILESMWFALLTEIKHDSYFYFANAVSE